MTAEQKTHLASFLDLAADTLRGGYTRKREPYAFLDDASPNNASPPPAVRPLVMLVGEGLENNSDAVQLLDRMLASIGLFRGKNCLIAGEEQISVLKPLAILCLGYTSILAYAEDGFPCADGDTIPLLSTYHPNELLQNGDLKRPAWEDLKSLRARLMELDGDYAHSMTEGS